jgi:hypothetical protein
MRTVKSFPWKRFWCRREDSYNLADRGFLTDPTGEHGELLNPHLTTFDQLQAVGCLALLGEPGVGKSWSLMVDIDEFRQQSPDLPMIHLNLRSFGSEDRLYKSLFENQVLLQWINGDYDLHLYLDSFDECLLRIDTIAALLADELPKLPLNRLKLRIACRTAPWPLLLENALKAGYGNDNFAATELVPLRRVDVLEAATLSGISKPNAFLERVDQLQIAALASRPITLTMLLDTFQREGDLPANLLDLYEKGCLILCEEQNESRRAAGRTGTLSPASRSAVAARIAAVTQFGNRFAVWTGTAAAGGLPEDVAVSQLVGGNEFAEQKIDVSNDMVVETLGTGLFSSRGPERLGWSHQTFAEYLAARYCINNKLPIQQLRSLVFHPRRVRVIPQMREVASWLALQNEPLFAEIAEHDPEVLLGSASPSLSDEQRRIVAATLLRRCDEGGFLHIHHHLPLRNLAHPTLAERLEPILRDTSRSMATRYFAAKIARDCSVTSLVEVLVAIALSDIETNEIRTISGYAVGDIGSKQERDQLQPLLEASREIDPNDELRGVALRAIYPGDIYDDAMWDYLEHPRRSLFFGSYSSFLSYSVVPKLNAENLPAALRWCMRQPVEDLGPIPELEAEIFFLAAENIAAESVADSLARAVFERCKAYRGFAKRRHGKDKNAEDLLLEDDARRRRFLEAFLPLLNPDNVHAVMHPLSILTLKDLPWFIDRVVTGTSRFPGLEAMLICRLARSWESEAMAAVWEACQVNEMIEGECKGLFEPASLSEAAQWRTPSREEFLKEHNIQMAPAIGPRIEAALDKTEAGQADEWLRLVSEMSIEEGATHYVAFQQMHIENLPGWVGSSEETRARILEAAKQYLAQSNFPELESSAARQIRNGASAAVNALVLLHSTEPLYLQTQPADFWIRWIPSVVEDGRAGHDKEPGIKAVFRFAAESAPDAMNDRLLEQLRFENGSEQRYFFSSTLVDEAWSQSLGILLLDELRQNDLIPSIQGGVLYTLLQNGVSGAREWAEATIQTEHDSERGMALSKAFLNEGEEAAWVVLWPIIREDAPFGRELLESISFGRPNKSAFAAGFSDLQLEEFYGWLLEQYPPADDRDVSGPIGPVDTVRFLREGTLELIKKRGTFESCDVLTRIELRFPQFRWLRFHFDQAEVLACTLTWEAPSPIDVLAMAANRSKRFVESSEQLLDAIFESLDRLEAELHGELASIGDLWNFERGEWWPKQEEDVSDYVTRFLKRDLADRGIVVNREVQIRRGRDDMTGQNTDIHVDAPPTEHSQAVHYGPISVLIEVKGSWNNGLMTDMEGQLRDRYMKNSGCRVGLYVVAHFSATNWRASDNRRAKSNVWEIGELRRRLAAQAIDLSGSMLIRSFVLDTSLNSTKATGIEEQDEKR